jgi:hypothetical protein
MSMRFLALVKGSRLGAIVVIVFGLLGYGPLVQEAAAGVVPRNRSRIITVGRETGNMGDNAVAECLVAMVPAILVKPEEQTQENPEIKGKPDACPKQSPSEKQEGPQLVQIAGGYTSKTHPTFWFYVPYTGGDGRMKFLLTDDLETKQSAYSEVRSLPDNPGFIKITLPKDKQGILFGKQYRFSLTIYKDSQQSQSLASVSGLIEHRAAPDNIAQLKGLAQSQAYFNQGLRIDALSTLMDLRTASPNQFEKEWISTLDEMGLKSLSTKVIVSQ